MPVGQPLGPRRGGTQHGIRAKLTETGAGSAGDVGRHEPTRCTHDGVRLTATAETWLQVDVMSLHLCIVRADAVLEQLLLYGSAQRFRGGEIEGLTDLCAYGYSFEPFKRTILLQIREAFNRTKDHFLSRKRFHIKPSWRLVGGRCALKVIQAFSAN